MLGETPSTQLPPPPFRAQGRMLAHPSLEDGWARAGRDSEHPTTIPATKHRPPLPLVRVRLQAVRRKGWGPMGVRISVSPRRRPDCKGAAIPDGAGVQQLSSSTSSVSSRPHLRSHGVNGRPSPSLALEVGWIPWQSFRQSFLPLCVRWPEQVVPNLYGWLDVQPPHLEHPKVDKQCPSNS